MLKKSKSVIGAEGRQGEQSRVSVFMQSGKSKIQRKSKRADVSCAVDVTDEACFN